MTLAATNYETSETQYTSADEAASRMERSQWLRRTSWGAILAGAVSAIGLQALFTVLGAAIGIASYMGQGADGQGVGMFAGIWWVISGTVSLLLGGMIVGRMITIPRNAELMVHGFTMWAVTAIFGVLFIWSSAGMVGEVGTQSMGNDSSLQGSAQTQSIDSDAQPGSANQGIATAAMNTSAEQVQSSASAASWWTLVALLMGIGASLVGTYIGATPLGQQANENKHRPRTS